ncbi:Peptide chain release factor 1 [Streptomyces badius]
MFEAVEELIGEHTGLEKKLADPSVHADQANARKLNKRYAELTPIVSTYRAWKQTGEDIETAREYAADDPDFAAEVKELEKEREELTEKLRLLLGSPNTLHGLVTDFSEEAWELVDAFWPGALTLVARHQPSLQWDLGDTRGTVAIRMPLHPVAIELLTEVGPMAVSCANLTGHPSPEDCDAAQGMLGDSVSVYLDGGPTPGNVPSSIVDVTGAVPVLLRAGALSGGGTAQGGPRPRGGQLTAPEGRGIAGRTDTFRILHVSTGNVCRSPITERLTRHALVDRLGARSAAASIVESAGTWGHEGAPMEANAEVRPRRLRRGRPGRLHRARTARRARHPRRTWSSPPPADHRAQVISMRRSGCGPEMAGETCGAARA